MLKLRVLLTSCAFALVGLSSASAALPTPAYVDASLSPAADTGTCPVTAPCASLNYALSQITAGGTVIILKPGVFGPIILTANVSITGIEPNSDVIIAADPAALVGCIGSAPTANCGGHTNSGYAVEIAAGPTDGVKIGHLGMAAGNSGGSGALKLSSGGAIQIAHDIFRGSGSATTPMILLAPSNPGTTQVQDYFSNSDVGFNNGASLTAGAVLVQPIGTTSLKLHFNHVEVHNASFGIRTDGSGLSAGTNVSTFISDSEFFSFPNAAVNAFSSAGTGTVNAAFDTTRILNAGAALKANGPLSFVILTNNTVSGNGFGVQVLGGAAVLSSVNNTITGNGPSNNQNVVVTSGTYNPAALQ
jgi:hypothetical protein